MLIDQNPNIPVNEPEPDSVRQVIFPDEDHRLVAPGEFVVTFHCVCKKEQTCIAISRCD